jgi:hypothetical protein
MKILKTLIASFLIAGMFAIVACGNDAASSTEGTESEMQEAPAEEHPSEGEHPEGSEHPSEGEHPSGGEHPSN